MRRRCSIRCRDHLCRLDAQSDALAAALVAGGFARGDRLGLYLQNVPQFVVAMLAGWKAGGIAVPISPMSRASDAQAAARLRPAAILAQEDLAHHLVQALADLPGHAPRIVSAAAWGQSDPICRRRCPMRRAKAAGGAAGRICGPGCADPSLMLMRPPFWSIPRAPRASPRGIISHANVVANARIIAAWYGLRSGMGPVLGLAPLFHVTGLVGHIAVAWQLAAPLVLAYRFHPETMLEAIARHRPCFTVGAITAYIAMMQSGASTPAHYASFTRWYRAGRRSRLPSWKSFSRIRGAASSTAMALPRPAPRWWPCRRGAPRRWTRPAARFRWACPNMAWICGWRGEDEARLGVGEVGEIVVSGPTVARGYWNRPADTAAAMRPDGFRTGDVGFMDAAGWVYLVDRKKDMINASGYKVWPREVEDVLYTHPAVREVAVVGVPDAYRGESVRAVISLREGRPDRRR
jgi:long-chain acyl-CoA synthetase